MSRDKWMVNCTKMDIGLGWVYDILTYDIRNTMVTYTHMYTQAHAHRHTHTRIHAHTHRPTHACTHTHAHTHTCNTHIHATHTCSTHTDTDAHTYTHLYTCADTCIHTCGVRWEEKSLVNTVLYYLGKFGKPLVVYHILPSIVLWHS